MMIASAARADKGVEIAVSLSPAGRFIAKTSDIQGYAVKSGSGYSAQNVVVDLRNLSTGVGLRDKHTKEHLMVSKYPQAKLINVEGKNGKGTATIEVKGIKRTVEGTYTVSGKTLKASFPMALSELDIKGVRYMGVGVKDTVQVNVEIPIMDGAKRTTASTPKK